MRRDVRMGFAVGGVLLAVIIVAFLAIHRNHNKAVAFDKGAADGSADVSSVDVNASAADAAVRTPPPNAIEVKDATAAKISTERVADPKPSEAEKADADRWDALFASTGPNPAQGQLSQNAATGSSRNTRKNDKNPSKPMKFMEAPAAPSNDGQASQPAVVTDPAPPQTSGAATGVRTHIVHANETLSGISKTVYGSSKHYKAIEAANPGLDPTKLRPGMVLKIPPLEQAKHIVKQQSADAASAADGKTYTVQQNDNLYKITRKLYGNGDKQEALYELNKATIGPDSTKLKPGMVLKLPAAPAAQ